MTADCACDGFMAIILILINEIPSVKNEYSGMATGFIMFFMGLGNLVAPSVGNSLANGTLVGAPLIFCAVMILFSGMCIFFTSRRKPALRDLKSTDMEGF